MTAEEWLNVKTLINTKRQEKAMRWWAVQFEIPFAQAVGIINRIQIVLQYGTDEQKSAIITE